MDNGCTNFVLRNDTGEKEPCGRIIYKAHLCESCFCDELTKLTARMNVHRRDMLKVIDKIGSLFREEKQS